MTTAMTKTVREIAVEQPGASRVFENLGIDYCCGGEKALQEACLAAGMPTESVVTLLEDARNGASSASETRDWNSAPLSELVGYIVTKHHAFTREELPWQQIATFAS